MLRFKFISSGDDQSWSIQEWGKPHDDVRFNIHSRPPLLFLGAQRRLNYTDAEYQKWLVDTTGYLRWHADGPMPWPICRQFRDERVAEYNAVFVKYPDIDIGPPPNIKGRWYISPDGLTPIIEDFPPE